MYISPPRLEDARMKLGRIAVFALLAVLPGCGDAPTPTAAARAPDAPRLAATYRVQVNCPLVLYVGNSGFCNAQGYDVNNFPTSSLAFYTSGNPSSVSVSGSMVTANAPSGATITAWIDGVRGYAYVSVQYTPVLTSVAVTPTPTSVNRYYTRQLTAKGYDQYGAQMSGLSFSWSSSNTAVATVNSSGLVYGASAGSATITASTGGTSGAASVSVVIPSVSAGISGPSSVPRNQATQFTGTGSGGSGPYTYEWRKRSGSSSTWNAWESWTSPSTSNTTWVYVANCGVNRVELELRVTDSLGATGSTSYTFYVTNAC
jgi:hypothetical protein